MKIGAKIRGVLEKYPEIRKRRAQINAIEYLSKEAEPGDVEWHTDHSQTDTCLVYYPRNANGHRCDMTIIHMKSLSEYKYEPPIPIPNGDKGFTEPLGANVKLVFKDGKLEVAP